MTSFATTHLARLAVAAAAFGLPLLARAGAAGPTSSPAGGLDSLTDDALYADLARRGLDSLLERAFEQNRVPAEQRETIRMMAAARNPSLPAAQREAILAQSTRSVDRLVAAEKDPNVLFDQASDVIKSSVAPALEVVEYWGGTTQSMARLRPVAESASRLLARASELYRAEADALANKLDANNPAPAAVARYQKADGMANNAEYTRRINDYAVVLSLDPADTSRAKIADDAIDFLRQFDTPDYPVHAAIHVRIGKLQLAKGSLDEAIATLDAVWEDAGKILPEPAPANRYEARYFAAVAAMGAGRFDDAEKRLDGLAAWAKTNIAAESQHGAQAVEMLLRYRIDAAAKRDDKARDDLLALLKARPEFENKILDQLASRVSDGADVHTLDLLSLKAVLRKGQVEQQRPDDQKVDAKVLDHGIAAAQELIARRGASGLTEEMVEDASIYLPLFYERAGRSLDAVGALLDYIEAFSPRGKQIVPALNEAMTLVAKLREENAEDVAVGRAYDRLLKIAVNPPFGRADLFYEWARRLQSTGNYEESARWFALVPGSDPHAPVARFLRLVALKQVMDERSASQADAVRRANADALLELATQVAAEARERLAKGAEVQKDTMILAQTSFFVADVSLRQKKDPAAALAALEGIEATVAPLPGAKQLVAQAMNLRVLALVDAGRNKEATDTLVALLQATGGGEGADIVLKLLTRLSDDFDAARKSGDAKAMESLARSRAELSGFLVTWAEKNPDPKIRELTYRYRIFDADTKRLAAGLATDPEQRKRGLENALALYKGLADPGRPDGIVDLGIGLIEYDLGHFDEARDVLGTLLRDRRLGRPTLEEERDGAIVTVSNDRYWEAFLKNIRANLKLVEQGNAGADVKQKMVDALAEQYARWGRSLGGAKWGPDFEKLRQEIAPEYQVPDLSGK